MSTVPTQLYYVPSSANVKHRGETPRFYLVREAAGRFTCECTAASFGRRCWHVDVCVSGAVKPARPKAQPAPVRRDTSLVDSLYS